MNLIRQTVLRIVEDQVNSHDNGSEVRIRAELSDSLGSNVYDSLDIVEICLKLESEFGISISDEQAENFNKMTVSEVAHFVESKFC